MTTDLIAFHAQVISDQQVETVNARELHSFLEVGRDYSTWIKNRIKQYKFEECQDFILIHQNGGTNGKGGDRRSVDYFITLDMAKELAMVERNEKGRQARRYFIECERQLKEKLQQEAQPAQPELNLQSPVTNLLDRVRMLLVFEKGNLVHTRAIKEDELLTSTEPKYLAQFVRECMPDYALVKKENVLKAKELLGVLA
ncbi:antA/AntB antirepressor family protein [Endozoicomonas sp. SM1973]|uniref:AntA/AntB antirepressor family protein n=1 Tax=Spartinivicinus marinus TaxID=2994442 RepID=A0A853IEM7_9GAMM|nr:antA/AntB antirepressor family protein [Spartinivicinus marinus]MCX4025058.1 antA/AntB antirepressor family protein [Spartinivicinus marinus]NYZ68988.1 antA/AntB antirepressor family protein [Spartinivicinus marinus]